MNENKKLNKILFIVESPNKIKTLEKILPSNYIVTACVGHITKINDSGKYNMGIDPDNNFKADYIVSTDKKDIVKKLKDLSSKCSKVIIASDGDREGELIAYMLKKFLKLKNSDYERITFHEITKKAVLEALNHPRKIDENLALAAMSRAKLDKIVGYRLSPITRRNNIGRSVGRCQSAGLKLIVDKEKEINQFIIENYYELYLSFIENNNTYKCKYIGTEDKKVDKFKELDDVVNIMNQCMNNNYIIKNIEFKDRKESPKPPFTTSTFQQEVSNKLNIPVKKAMEYAQRLFEGIDVNGEHIALITYIRTDSTDLAPEFISQLKQFIIKSFGNDYYSENKFKSKKENIQDGHEAIRPVDLNMTPENLSLCITDYNLLRVYKIIYDRTIASYMKPAIIQDTNYYIYNKDNIFQLILHALKFDGYKKIYNYKDENSEEISLLPKFNLNYIIKNPTLNPELKQTKPPKRYTEASFINTLDKLGIGRPSTYSTIVSTLLDKTRNYCYLENKEIIPTEQGIKLSNFLDNQFSDIININYTSQLEKELDSISEGKIKDVDFLSLFYNKLEESINKVEPIIEASKRTCPNCGSELVYRTGKYGPFLACPKYPKCKYIEKI